MSTNDNWCSHCNAPYVTMDPGLRTCSTGRIACAEYVKASQVKSAVYRAHTRWSLAVMCGEPESTCTALYAEYQRLAAAAGL
jgi:hypothetical protein